MYILTTNNDVFRFDQKGLHLLMHIPSAKPIFDLGVNTDMISIENGERTIVELYDTLGKKLNQFPTLTLPSFFHGEPGFWFSFAQQNPGEQLFVYGDNNNVVSFYSILTRNGFSAIKPISTAGHTRQLSGYDIYQKKLWGLENSDHLFVLDPQTGEIEYPPYDNKFNSKAIFNDPIGLVWLGNDNGSSFTPKGQNILLRTWSLIDLFIPAGAFPKIVMEIFMSLRIGAISYFIRKQKPSNPGLWQNHWRAWLALQTKMMISGFPVKNFFFFDTIRLLQH
jgi:hypothetical protein